MKPMTPKEVAEGILIERGLTSMAAERPVMRKKMAAAKRIENIKDMQSLGVLRGEAWGEAA